MIISKSVDVPTGQILVVQGAHGPLECLSIGDYGKDINIKADFLGLEREPSPVRHTKLLPLEEKWVVTISSQYGCRANCKFCDVPMVSGGGKNATFEDMMGQIATCINLHPEVEYTKRLNVHFARMGEPTFNPNVIGVGAMLSSLSYEYNFFTHPVVSTMMPRHNPDLRDFISDWVFVKNIIHGGDAGLQLSINSTDEDERESQFNGQALTLEEIAKVMEGFKPAGRKFTLNFAIADWTIDPEILLKYFDPDDYIIKLTPMHKTKAATDNNIITDGDYTEYHPYKDIEKSLTGAGYDVLVFIASKEEDESRITCGNAILALGDE
ncbi:MAG: Fe-S-oxidoreductase [Candidatus Dojkabacteria bacterium]